MSVAGPENTACAMFPGEDSHMNVQATVIPPLMTVTLGHTSMTAAWIFGPRRAACVSVPVHCISCGRQTGEESQICRMDIHVRRMTTHRRRSEGCHRSPVFCLQRDEIETVARRLSSMAAAAMANGVSAARKVRLISASVRP